MTDNFKERIGMNYYAEDRNKDIREAEQSKAKRSKELDVRTFMITYGVGWSLLQ